MLILFKPSLKTSLLLLLFTGGINYLTAAGLPMINPVQHQFHTSGITQHTFSEDTVQTEISRKDTLVKETSVIPDNLADTPIDFRVNSDIQYLNFKHFVNNESERMFYQAWLKEAELKKISLQTDSLRKLYAGSVNEEKDKIAIHILKNEEHATTLNQEIVALSQSVREQEDQYWKKKSSTEKIKFQEKVKAYSDSLIQSKQKLEIENTSKTISDTLIIFQESSLKKEVKPETAATDIVYKIQIVAYKVKLPESANTMIKKLSALRKVENYTDEKGVKIYTTGNLKTYQEAFTMQAQVKQEGVKNPIIIAFQKGKKITVDEAKKLNNEL
jgi:hypothetical protein